MKKLGWVEIIKTRKKWSREDSQQKQKKMKWGEIISQTRQKNEKLEIIVSVI